MASGLVNAKMLPPLMLSGVVVLAYGAVGISGAAPPLRLSSEPMFAKDGKPVTISCRDTRGNNITTARWYRHNLEIFQTSHLKPHQILNVTGNASVYERVAVNATLRHHDVILQFNSTLDKRSVWWCRNGKESSYNMTLCSEHTDECIRPNLTMEPQKAEDDNNVTLSCRHGGGRNMTSVLWYRNYVYIFQTSTRSPETLQDKQSDKEDYKAVEERISVKVNPTVHNVILKMNSTLDVESVWTCDNNQKFSNDLVIDTSQTGESTTLPQRSTPTTNENDTSRKTTIALKTMPTTKENDTPSRPSPLAVTTQTTKDNLSTDEGTTSAATLTTSQPQNLTSTPKPTMQTTTLVSSPNNVSTTEGTASATTLTTSQSKDLTSAHPPTMQTTTPGSSPINEFILYVIVGSAGGLVLVISIAVTVCLLCVRKMLGSKDSDKGKNVNADGRPDGNSGGLQMNVMDSNEYAYIGNNSRCDVHYERESADMVDNVMYHDYTYRSRTEGEDNLHPGETREPVGTAPYEEMVDNVCYDGCSDSDVSDTSYWEYNGPADQKV